MNKMYVWEVSHDIQYDGVIRSILIKDDKDTLKKVKEELVFLYNNFCFYEDVKREGLANVDKIKTLGDIQFFKLSSDSKIEVEKIEVF